MAQPSKKDELHTAWRALSGKRDTDGWSTIQVFRGASYRFLAARHFPGNEEALLIGFCGIRIPPEEYFPEGQGFVVSRVDHLDDHADRVWVGLCRQHAGSLELFTMVVEDIVATLNRHYNVGEVNLLNLFFSRLRAWQYFMRHGVNAGLSATAELGLFGELEFIKGLIFSGVPISNVISAWQGPLNGIQDFTFGNGAIEVKSTLSPVGFPATINSIEQLDDSLIQPIFLAGIRFELSVSGKTLCDQVADVRNLLCKEFDALELFEIRLLHADYFENSADQYTRRFSKREMKIFPVAGGEFPRLTRANVAIEIRRVRYDVDLDLIIIPDLGIGHVLQQLGVI